MKTAILLLAGFLAGAAIMFACLHRYSIFPCGSAIATVIKIDHLTGKTWTSSTVDPYWREMSDRE